MPKYSFCSLESSLPGSPGFILSKNLKTTKHALKTWNTLHFGNIQQKIEATYCRLDKMQQLGVSIYEELALKKELDELLLQEELLWKSKSREIWLTCKDLNMRFFHLSTLI